MNLSFIKIKALLSLGLLSLVRVLIYRVGLKLGLNPVKRLQGEIEQGLFFSLDSVKKSQASRVENRSSNDAWSNSLSYFSWRRIDHESAVAPDWFYDPFSQARFSDDESPWWKIPDFGATSADIKSIWELSRFDWVIAFAQKGAKGDVSAIENLNAWLRDWSEKNPPYVGPNWKCGQEASIRVVHLLLAAMFLDQDKTPSPAFVSLIACHLKRIRPTLMYALGQDNNHGTSEAAALFMGGVFLREQDVAQGANYERVGRKYLNERALKLILSDGTFSQYSITYHRLMLETFSLCEVWARRYGIRVLKNKAITRISAATHWLQAVLIEANGDVPNLGANDGAHLLPLTNASYRDFRPCVALASALFGGNYVTNDSNVQDHLAWFGLEGKVSSGSVSDVKKLEHMPSGGFICLRRQRVFAMLSYPVFKFRPSQSDLMHLDVWVNDVNLLRDGGSYSYNTLPEKMSYYGGVRSHNTISFDGREQMPRVSRFLFVAWPKAYAVSALDSREGKSSCEATYKDWLGVYHKRATCLDAKTLEVVDECSGFLESATIRWRLAPAQWKITHHSIESELAKITIESSQSAESFKLVQGSESRYYMQETEIPVLEVFFNSVEDLLSIKTTVTIK